jgi:hypothetical protein
VFRFQQKKINWISKRLSFFHFFELELVCYLKGRFSSGALLSRFACFFDCFGGKRSYIEDYLDHHLATSNLKQREMALLALLGCMGLYELSSSGHSEVLSLFFCSFSFLNSHSLFLLFVQTLPSHSWCCQMIDSLDDMKYYCELDLTKEFGKFAQCIPIGLREAAQRIANSNSYSWLRVAPFLRQHDQLPVVPVSRFPPS